MTGPGVISLLMFLLFAVMPTLVGRFTAAGFEHDDYGEVDRWKTDRGDAGHPYRLESGFGGTFLGGLSISALPTKEGIVKRSPGGIAGTRAPKK